MRRSLLPAALAAVAMFTTAVPVAARADVPVTLRGSLSAMERQHGVAMDLGFIFVRTPIEVEALVESGDLVRLEGNADYGFRAGVHSLVARPEMRTFVERLSSEYRVACDEKLVVTSLTRPTTRQPRNAHRLSVHPAGIAVDLRVSTKVACRQWLEKTLLAMEDAGLLDVTRERYPPHYHIALFPDAYMSFIAPLIEAERLRAEREEAARKAAAPLYAMVAAPPPAQEGDDLGWHMLAALPLVALAGLRLTRSLSPGHPHTAARTGRRTPSPARSPLRSRRPMPERSAD